MTKEDEIINLVGSLNDTLQEVDRIKDFLKSTGRSERFFIAKEIISKLTTLLTDLHKTQDLLPKYATLRYIFETLVNVRLLNKDEAFTYQLYYAIFNTQVEKTKKLLSRINDEIKKAKEYGLREKQELNELNKDIQKIDPTEFQRRLNSLTESIDRDSDYESVVFWGNYKANGYDFTAHLIENKLKPEYEQRLIEMNKKLDRVTTKLFENEKIKSLFDFKSEKEVFEKLTKWDKWSVKAKNANMETDYDLIYDLSSSILHSTAYSLFTSNELDESDNELIHSMTTRYVRNVIKGIEDYLDIERTRKIVFVKG